MLLFIHYILLLSLRECEMFIFNQILFVVFDFFLFTLFHLLWVVSHRHIYKEGEQQNIIYDIFLYMWLSTEVSLTTTVLTIASML